MISRLSMLLLPLCWVACGSSEEPSNTAQTEDVAAAIDGALLMQSWPARMANDENRGPFEGDPGWQHFFAHDLGPALTAFSASKNDRGMARVHQLLSSMYGQGALLAANATEQAYGVDGVETDPVEVSYVLGVSGVIRGDFDGARERLKSVPPDTPVHERAQKWLDLLNASASIPDLGALQSISGSLGDVTAGTTPQPQALPHFEVAERTEKGRLMAMNDPTDLLAHAAWHRAAAKMVAPETDKGVLEQLDKRYSIVRQDVPTQTVLALDDAWLFCAPDLSPADAGFIAAATTGGLAAVEKWGGRSPLAAALVPAVAEGRIAPQGVMDAAFSLQKQLGRAMADIGGGEQGFHRPFALRARVAVLLAGMIVADANDQYRDAGILRLNALERMEAIGVDPVFALSVAAWDAGNRNPLRPEDILHQFGATYPALVAAKAPLEALHLRRSRNATPTTPVH